MGKKAVEMGRYYGSEALRNKKLQKKAIDYALDKLNSMIQNVGSQALNQLSTKIRPKKNYKTNRKDLDGGAIDIQLGQPMQWPCGMILIIVFAVITESVKIKLTVKW